MPAVMTETEVGDVIVTEEEAEELFCASCGDAADTLDAQEYGRCCHNLPRPWHQGRDGLYNSTTEVLHDEDEDEDRPEAPSCHNCGSTEWNVTQEQRVDTSRDEEPDGETIYFDYGDFENTSARCAHCDMSMPRGYNLESC